MNKRNRYAALGNAKHRSKLPKLEVAGSTPVVRFGPGYGSIIGPS